VTDRTLGDTIYFKFSTRAFATGIPTTLSGTPVLSAYEDASVTQITSGVSVTADLDGVTGLNLATIVATSGNGFEAGKQYGIVITTGTVDSVSVVGEVVGNFTLEASAAFTRLGAPAGASVSADIADVPTVAEFNARTLTAADYFDPAADAVALAASQPNYAPAKAGDNMGTVSSVTGNVDGSVASVVAAVTTDTASRDASKADVSGLSTFDPTTDPVANVTTVGNMRGTDGANTTAPDNASISAILIDTGASIPASIAALNDVSVSDILTTQMTEAYAADGVAPTLAQAIFLIQQSIGDFAIAGTTITTKKIDGSTTAATYTLDDGTSPTSRARST